MAERQYHTTAFVTNMYGNGYGKTAVRLERVASEGEAQFLRVVDDNGAESIYPLGSEPGQWTIISWDDTLIILSMTV